MDKASKTPADTTSCHDERVESAPSPDPKSRKSTVRKSKNKKTAAARAVPRKPKLTHRKIIDTAIEISRELSISEVTIRAVATRLAVSPMALYKHVGGKGELEYQVAFNILERSLHPEKIDDDVAWDDAIRKLASDLVAVIEVHPTILRVFCEHPLEPPLIGFYERLYQAFSACGIPIAEHRLYGRILVNYLIGSVMMSLNASEKADRSFQTQLDQLWNSPSFENYKSLSAALHADSKLSLRDYAPPLEPIIAWLAARAAAG